MILSSPCYIFHSPFPSTSVMEKANWCIYKNKKIQQTTLTFETRYYYLKMRTSPSCCLYMYICTPYNTHHCKHPVIYNVREPCTTILCGYIHPEWKSTTLKIAKDTFTLIKWLPLHFYIGAKWDILKRLILDTYIFFKFGNMC